MENNEEECPLKQGSPFTSIQLLLYSEHLQNKKKKKVYKLFC